MNFEEAYRLYFRDVFSYACSLCRNESIAEEVTQETFFKAFRSIDQFDGSRDIHAWLFTIAKNTYISFCRKKRRISDSENFEQILENTPSGDVSFTEQVTDDEQAFLIHRFLHEMEEPYKKVFTLRVFGELPFEKIGVLFGKSAGWARVTFHRAKQQIRNYMEGIEHENKL